MAEAPVASGFDPYSWCCQIAKYTSGPITFRCMHGYMVAQLAFHVHDLFEFSSQLVRFFPAASLCALLLPLSAVNSPQYVGIFFIPFPCFFGVFVCLFIQVDY